MHQSFIKKIAMCLAVLISLYCQMLMADYTQADAISLRLHPPVVNGTMSPDIAAIQQRGTLRWAIYKYSMPPFSMQDSQGNWSGIEIDYAQLIAKELGVKLVIVPSETYDGIVDLVANNQADIGSGLSITGPRAMKVSYTESYYSFNPHLLVNRLQASQKGWNNNAQVVNGIKQSKTPIKIGVLAGSSAVQITRQIFPNAQEVLYSSSDEGLDDVLNGKIFAAAGLSPVQVQAFLRSNSKSGLMGEDITVTQSVDLIALVVPWQDYHLREWLNVFFYYIGQNDIDQNNIKAKIMKKYASSL